MRYGYGKNEEEGRCWKKFESVHDDYIIENDRVMTPRLYNDRRVVSYEPHSFLLGGNHIDSELSTNDSAMNYVTYLHQKHSHNLYPF